MRTTASSEWCLLLWIYNIISQGYWGKAPTVGTVLPDLDQWTHFYCCMVYTVISPLCGMVWSLFWQCSDSCACTRKITTRTWCKEVVSYAGGREDWKHFCWSSRHLTINTLWALCVIIAISKVRVPNFMAYLRQYSGIVTPWAFTYMLWCV